MKKNSNNGGMDLSDRLPFKLKLLLIAILPIIGVSIMTGLIIHVGANRLIEWESTLIEKRILATRQKELKNYIALALTAINHEYQHGDENPREAQKAVQQILHNLNYGDDGYFFAYDRKGTSLVNAPSPDLIGDNLWYLKDETGNFFIQELMSKAVNGGGFYTYVWNKPSTNQKTQKLGYATYLPKWGWMIGTGHYLDDIEQEVRVFKADMHKEIRDAESILFLAALFAVVVTAVAVAAIHYNEHKLADMRLKALTRRIVDIQEEERKRVSTDLHDGINQLLVSVRHRLELAAEQLINPDKASLLLQKSLSILDTSISDIRRISKDLHPSALDNIGLAVAIRELGHDFSESTGIEINTHAQPVGNRLSDSAKIAIYRVLQEALTNVSRHASADKVDVEMHVDDNNKRVTIRIADNGIGIPNIDQKQGRRGLGLRNMVERMESQGGTLTIRNNKAGGLELLGVMPQVQAS